MIGDRWGVSDSEVSRSYPCDAFVTAPTLRAWRGVAVQAPAGAVWPWVVQVGVAPSSYDWIDNLGRRSPRELVGVPDPRVGERFTTAGGRELGQVLSVDPGKQLTGTVMGAVMSYVLVPQGHAATRLLLKVVMRTSRWAAPGLCVGDLVMARRQSLNWKRLAERHQHRATGAG
ncbi:polyketide cyclase [Marinitenerispora sediminis]|uniref:Polyketide cyclase n=1 Tax=Marinitenerispora sediminis TaxID=1931232 RepID=A0A368T396_9ACTN|nr:polyketide cyclase [Marinitenerispora sediminis]RCV49523.1 polyketide cyclase [Marinitenerispora sediminis]RCV55829.1 polyketide cyclase [Marinitenerispora sediminis]RCV56903.1 polyketide cyclase [Marinitenerispora sediminis]